MAGPFDLTGQNIEDSYQRILQTPDGVNIYDGTGSAFTVTAVAAPAGPNQSIQFNDAGTTSGSGNFTFNKTNNSASLTGSLIVSDSVYFNGSQASGRLTWNSTDGTLDLGMGYSNATQQIGQELYLPPVVNESGEDLLDGNLVMVNPAGVAQGNRISVTKCVSDGTYPADYIVGVLTNDLPNNQEGLATWFGYVRNINKTHLVPTGETWAEGDVLYPHPTLAGYMTHTQPTAPHLKSTKENACGCAGIFSAASAIELYAAVFDELNILEKLEAFASFYGADFYELERNQSSINLTKEDWTVPEKITVGDDEIIPLFAERKVSWKLI